MRLIPLLIPWERARIRRRKRQVRRQRPVSDHGDVRHDREPEQDVEHDHPDVSYDLSAWAAHWRTKYGTSLRRRSTSLTDTAKVKASHDAVMIESTPGVSHDMEATHQGQEGSGRDVGRRLFAQRRTCQRLFLLQRARSCEMSCQVSTRTARCQAETECQGATPPPHHRSFPTTAARHTTCWRPLLTVVCTASQRWSTSRTVSSIALTCMHLAFSNILLLACPLRAALPRVVGWVAR